MFMTCSRISPWSPRCDLCTFRWFVESESESAPLAFHIQSINQVFTSQIYWFLLKAVIIRDIEGREKDLTHFYHYFLLFVSKNKVCGTFFTVCGFACGYGALCESSLKMQKIHCLSFILLQYHIVCHNQLKSPKNSSFAAVYPSFTENFNFAARFLKIWRRGFFNLVAEISQDWGFRLTWNFQQRCILVRGVF